MISDLRLCQLCAKTYTEPLTFESAGVSLRVTKEIDDAGEEFNVVAFRGSVTPLDWARDFMFLPCKGGVPLGWTIDAQEAWARVPSEGKIILTGHSKGAVDAQKTALTFIDGGRPPVKMSTFGTPRLEFALQFGVHPSIQEKLAEIPGADYRNGHDPVPMLPPGYIHPRGIVQLGDGEGLLVAEDHHIDLYVAAMEDILS